MENKKRQIVSILILGLLMLAAFFFFRNYLGPKKTSTVPKSNSADSKASKINQEIYQKISTPKDFGQAVSPNEPGFGRINPFLPYK